jgi:hypothetical protein
MAALNKGENHRDGHRFQADTHLTLVIKWSVVDVHVEIEIRHAFAPLSLG